MTCFVDTNVLVYARDSNEPDKQDAADKWLAALWSGGAGRLSFQVLSEFYSIVTRRLDPPLAPAYARADVTDYLAWNPLALDYALLEAAWAIQDRFGFSWWDSLIVAAAQALECRYLLTEDLQHGQDLNGVTVVNPFKTAPEEFPELTARPPRPPGRR